MLFIGTIISPLPFAKYDRFTGDRRMIRDDNGKFVWGGWLKPYQYILEEASPDTVSEGYEGTVNAALEKAGMKDGTYRWKGGVLYVEKSQIKRAKAIIGRTKAIHEVPEIRPMDQYSTKEGIEESIGTLGMVMAIRLHKCGQKHRMAIKGAIRDLESFGSKIDPVLFDAKSSLDHLVAALLLHESFIKNDPKMAAEVENHFNKAFYAIRDFISHTKPSEVTLQPQYAAAVKVEKALVAMKNCTKTMRTESVEEADAMTEATTDMNRISRKIADVVNTMAGDAYDEDYIPHMQAYSGRAMYGKYCLGVSVGRYGQSELLKAFKKNRIPNPSQDQLGMGAIYYWQNIPYDPAIHKNLHSKDESVDHGVDALTEAFRLQDWARFKAQYPSPTPIRIVTKDRKVIDGRIKSIQRYDQGSAVGYYITLHPRKQGEDSIVIDDVDVMNVYFGDDAIRMRVIAKRLTQYPSKLRAESVEVTEAVSANKEFRLNRVKENQARIDRIKAYIQAKGLPPELKDTVGGRLPWLTTYNQTLGTEEYLKQGASAWLNFEGLYVGRELNRIVNVLKHHGIVIPYLESVKIGGSLTENDRMAFFKDSPPMQLKKGKKYALGFILVTVKDGGTPYRSGDYSTNGVSYMVEFPHPADVRNIVKGTLSMEPNGACRLMVGAMVIAQATRGGFGHVIPTEHYDWFLKHYRS